MYSSIHILGERNCGTNYLLQLLKENTDIPIYDTLLVHKHFIFNKKIIENHTDVLFLVITKELEHFLKALYNAPHHVIDVPLNDKGISSYKGTNISFTDFLQNEIKSDISFTNKRPDVKYKYSNLIENNNNPVDLYYDKLIFYLSLRVNKHQNIDYLKYEELNNNPNIIIPLLKKYNISTKFPSIKNVSFYKSDKNTVYKPTKYIELSETDKNIISKLKKESINKRIFVNNIDNIKLQYDEEKYFTKYTMYDPILNSEIKKIPKIIHFIWVGSVIPHKYIKSIISCKIINPLWNIYLWYDNPNTNNISLSGIEKHHISELNIITQDSYNFINNYGFKADLLRLEIVNIHGGIYSDIDSFWTQPLSEIFEFEFLNVRNDFRLKNISNSLFGFTKDSPILKNILKNIKTHLNHVEKYVGKNKQYVPVFSGPVLLSHFIEKYFKHQYKINYISQAFCMLGGLHQDYGACYRHFGNYKELIFTYQTFDGNW